MAQALLIEFPDARILFTSRDPRAAVPSQLSSLRPALGACGFAEYPDALRDGLVDLLLYYYEHLYEGAAKNPDRMVLLYNNDVTEPVLYVPRRGPWAVLAMTIWTDCRSASTRRLQAFTIPSRALFAARQW